MGLHTPKPGAPGSDTLALNALTTDERVRKYLERERDRAINKLRDLDDLLGRPQTLGPRRERE